MFGSGNTPTSWVAVGSRHPVAITFPATQPVWPLTRESLKAWLNSVKFPVFISGVGTVDWMVVALRLVKNWKSPKKNVLFFHTGPPIVAPYWFWAKCPRGTPLRLLKKEFASSELLRRYSQTSPWKELLPDLIVAFTNAPAPVPNPAESCP